jgi:hypothetical protein
MKIVVPFYYGLLFVAPWKPYLSISANRTWKSHGNRVACDHMYSRVAHNNLKFKCHPCNMDRNRGSDALRQYPLYASPISRPYSSSFFQLQSPSTFIPRKPKDRVPPEHVIVYAIAHRPHHQPNSISSLEHLLERALNPHLASGV